VYCTPSFSTTWPAGPPWDTPLYVYGRHLAPAQRTLSPVSLYADDRHKSILVSVSFIVACLQLLVVDVMTWNCPDLGLHYAVQSPWTPGTVCTTEYQSSKLTNLCFILCTLASLFCQCQYSSLLPRAAVSALYSLAVLPLCISFLIILSFCSCILANLLIEVLFMRHNIINSVRRSLHKV